MPIRAWLSRLAALTVVPAAILLLAEIALRLAGVGFPTDFLLPSSTRADRSISNPRFGWRFFPPALARAPLPMELGDGDRFRIFVLGGSAALGTPEPAFSFGRILETMLAETHSDSPVEVVSATMPAISSHVVRVIARECAREKPDLFIVYMGNNEIVGPYGAGTVFGDFSPSLGLIRSSIHVKATRIGQLMHRAIAPEPSQEWRGMEMFLENRVPSDDPRLERVYSHFGQNLTAIVRRARRSGAKVILATVAVNLLDQPPFASETPAERSAELHYERGRALLRLGRADEARSELELARDLDTLRFRADSRINQTIREVAERERVTLVDVDELFRSVLPGYRYFHEHVHLNLAGNYALARALFDPVSDTLAGAPGDVPPPSIQKVAEQLVFSPHDQLAVEEEIFELVSRPPFTSRPDLAEHLTARRGRLAGLRASLVPGEWQRTRMRYEESLAKRPEDLFTRRRFAQLLGQYGDRQQALQHWQELVQRIPEIPDWQSGWALAAAGAGKVDEAVTALEEAVERWPPLAPGLLLNLGFVNERAGRFDEAKAAYHRALERRPHFRLALANLASLAAKRGELEEAMRGWRELLERYPDFTEAHHDLGVALETRGELEAAAASFRREIDSRPSDSRGHVSLGIVLEQLDRPEDALESFRRGLELDPFSSEALFALGDLLLSRGQAEAAVPFYRRGLELDPGHAQARENLELALRPLASR